MGTENNHAKQQQTTCSYSVVPKNGSSFSAAQLLNGSGQDQDIHHTVTKVVPHLSVTVDQNDVISGATRIIKIIRPEWDLNAVEYKLFTDGITNKLVGCFHKPSNGSDSPDISTTSDESSVDNVVLVRVYGHKTDLLIDRKAETRNIRLLHTYGFAPSLFATFKNGLAYEYVPGVTLTPDTVVQPCVWNLIARRMAEMHKVSNVEITSPKPMLSKKVQEMMTLIPEQFSDRSKQERLAKTFLPIQKIRTEFESLYRHLENIGSPIVFAHNDLLLGNIIYTESQNSVTFIDYEYADYNFQAYDIGNHFVEFAGIDEVDYTRYPSKDFQMEWLRVYLQTYLETDEVALRDIEKLYVQVNQFSLATQLFWSVWALIQAEHSDLEFDFVEYAHIRYNEYLARKKEFLALKWQ